MHSSEKNDTEEVPLCNTLQNDIFEYRAFLKMELGRSENTIVSYIYDITQFARFLQSKNILSFADVDADSLVEWMCEIAPNEKATTQSRKLSALKSLAGFLVDEKVWEKNYCDILSSPKLRRNVPEILSAQEVVALLDAPPKDTPEGMRDRAMLELMYASGLRVSELCALKESDIFANEHIMRITGKGAKTRLVPVGDYALNAIARYKQIRRELLGDNRECAELFVTRRGEKLSRKTFWYNIKKYALVAGIEKNVKPHILRHSFATHLLQNGANLMAIREMLGHSDLSTTQIYTNLLNEDIVTQHQKKHPRTKMDVEEFGQ